MFTFNQILTEHIQLRFDCQIQPSSICTVRLLVAYHTVKKLVLMLQMIDVSLHTILTLIAYFSFGISQDSITQHLLHTFNCLNLPQAI